MKNILRKILFTLLLVSATGLLSALLSGCATDDPGAIDTKPWDLPQGWEGPFPSTINNGR